MTTGKEMKKDGPIIVIDDDSDDREMMQEMLKSFGGSNEIILLDSGEAALKFLTTLDVQPFMVLSDINMPRMNGYMLRELVLADEKLRRMCVPYLFITTSCTQATIEEGYESSVHGIFQKANDYQTFRDTLGAIITYWKKADTPVVA